MMKSRQRRNPTFAKYQGAYIIPVMGPSGAGKSTFINKLLGKNVMRVEHGLDPSLTVTMQPVEVPEATIQQNLWLWPERSRKLFLVETPGLDDTFSNDNEILKNIAEWLAETYGVEARFPGAIYLQSIVDPRVTGATRWNFELFENLCGVVASGAVMFATTHWENLKPDDYILAARREAVLRDKLWRYMIAGGAQMSRVDGSDSPWEIVEAVLLKGASGTRLRIQMELMEWKKDLPDTDAARVLRKRVEEHIKTLIGRSGISSKSEETHSLAEEVKKLKGNSFLGSEFLARLLGL